MSSVAVFAGLLAVAPLLLLATTVVALWAHGPPGWLTSVLLGGGGRVGLPGDRRPLSG